MIKEGLILNRKEFLDILRDYLKKDFSEDQISDIIRDYEEYFINGKLDGKSESEIIFELGSPKKIVEENTYSKQTVAAKGVENTTAGFQFRTAESFLNSLNKKANTGADISKYEEGQRVYHKRFGEGTIQKIEPEGEDYKLEINFDKAGKKRLMAKFAGLEIIQYKI